MSTRTAPVALLTRVLTMLMMIMMIMVMMIKTRMPISGLVTLKMGKGLPSRIMCETSCPRESPSFLQELELPFISNLARQTAIFLHRRLHC